MARRRQDEDWILPVAQLIGLFVVLGFIFPQFRHAVTGIAWMFLLLMVVAIVAVFTVGIYKLASRRGTSGKHFTFRTSAPSVVAARSPTNPQTTEQLIEQLRSIDWFQLEALVALVYRKQGYKVSRRGGANPDGGIDLVIEKDGARSAVQCKHWKTWNVGVKAVREFLGALTDAGIDRGVFVTLGGEAKRLVDEHHIEVINETGLAQMLEATDARFDPTALEILRDTRKAQANSSGDAQLSQSARLKCQHEPLPHFFSVGNLSLSRRLNDIGAINLA